MRGLVTYAIHVNDVRIVGDDSTTNDVLRSSSSTIMTMSQLISLLYTLLNDSNLFDPSVQ
jgi:hypothetical protein